MHRNNIRLLSLIFCTTLLASLGAAGQQEQPEEQQFRIGVSKIVTHPALDAIEQGMMDYLSEQGFSIRYDSQSANGDISTAASIAQKFKADKSDLVVGIGTPVAQALANVFSETPVVFGGITDPLEAGLVPTYEPNDGNVGGVSDKNPVFDQIKLFSELTGAQTIGIVYTSGEANGVQLKDMVESATKELDLGFVAAGVSNSAEVKSAILSIASRIDGLYVGTDNTVVSAISSLGEVCKEQGIPLFTADPTSAVDLDYFMVWGFNYYKHGRKTGEAVAQVLRNEKQAGELGTIFITDPTEFELWFNLDRARALGISIPQELIAGAAVIHDQGERITR
ncbi:MAG TPA: ABC transporter substrate-binding protein [Sphaerochaetaceae bacterium]|nr:ABC transporter substrate-binding protein [Sphaerochaetaceae bacterium]